jgi:transposase
VAFCGGLPRPVRVAYEAGPTGFGLARALLAAGVWCVIAAPGKIERPAQDKIKTDRRDAERLVRLLMIDGLHAVRVPSPEEEALRDLVRAREDLRGDLMRARHRLGKLLLRHEVRYDGTGDNWTWRHRQWLSKVRLPERGAQTTLLDYLSAIDALVIRRDTPQQRSPSSSRHRRGPPQAADELRRAGAFGEELWPDPSPGGDHEVRLPARRRLLVEAAWHYRRPPLLGTALKRRQQDQPAVAIAIAWRAQQRLHHLWRRLDTQRGKRTTIVAAAVARHLTGFCWAIVTTDTDKHTAA